MVSSEYKITLDLHDMSSPVSLNVVQGDTGRKIIVSLMVDGVPYPISEGCFAVFTGKKPDGKILWNSCAIEGDTVVYEITEQTTAVVGSVPCRIRLCGSDGKLILSPDFTLIVDAPAVSDEEVTIVSENEVTALTELLIELQALKNELANGGSGGSGTGGGGSTVKVAEVTLKASAWVGNASPYCQIVTINGVTSFSQVDLKPSIEQLTIFHDKDLAFVTENENGVVKVYALGDKPTNDYTMQVSITEVIV